VLIQCKNMCTLELLGYCICSVEVTFLGWAYTLMNKTIPDLFLQGGDKFTGQLSEMCSVLVMCA